MENNHIKILINGEEIVNTPNSGGVLTVEDSFVFDSFKNGILTMFKNVLKVTVQIPKEYAHKFDAYKPGDRITLRTS